MKLKDELSKPKFAHKYTLSVSGFVRTFSFLSEAMSWERQEKDTIFMLFFEIYHSNSLQKYNWFICYLKWNDE